MSTQIRKYYPVLKKMVRMGNATRTRAIKQCNRELIDCISECAKNVIKGNVPLNKRQFTSLQRKKKDIRALASKRTSVKKKRVIASQKGGFLTSLLVPAVAALGSILADHLLPRRH